MKYTSEFHPGDRLLDGFVAISPALSGEAYWENLGSLWVHHDRVHDHLHTWRKLFRSSRRGREQLMREDEQRIRAGLPDQIDVFRGFSATGGEVGLAWSLNRELALGFAVKGAYDGSPRFDGAWIAHARIASRCVLACFQREAMPGVEVVVNVRHDHLQVARLTPDEQHHAELDGLIIGSQGMG